MLKPDKRRCGLWVLTGLWAVRVLAREKALGVVKRELRVIVMKGPSQNKGKKSHWVEKRE